MEKTTFEDYNFQGTINGKYKKWLDDPITMRRIFKPFNHLFSDLYFHMYKRDSNLKIISDKYEESFEGILSCIRQTKVVDITNNYNRDKNTIEFDGKQFFLNENKISVNELKNVVMDFNLTTNNWRTDVNLFMKPIDYAKKEKGYYKIFILNEEGNNPIIGDCFLIGDQWIKVEKKNSYRWDLFKKELLNMSLYVPQLEFYSINVVSSVEGYKIMNTDPHPVWPKDGLYFSNRIIEYLSRKYKEYTNGNSILTMLDEFDEQNKRFEDVIASYPKGFYPFRKTNLILDFIPDFNNPVGKNTWARDRGFLENRLKQYNLRNNNPEVISDFEYAYIGHINNKYRSWFEDKVSIKYILRDYNEFLPDYYFLITARNGENKIIKLMNCPETLEASYKGVFDLVKKERVLALKPDEGTHGKGFFKFLYQDGKYYLNNDEKSEGEIIDLLSDVNNQYIITEFISQHPYISRIYPGSVNTVRLTVFKKNGKDATIGNGYIRFGSNETNGVDNISAGGLGADLNVSNGFFGNAVDKSMNPCPCHPDTGVKIEGFVPNWELITKIVAEIANSIPEIEYMGFDVAITEKGFKLPEINRMPDYPKLNKLTRSTMDYVLYKLENKKKQYGYL